jgi:outer membrane protein assembly factor BamB
MKPFAILIFALLLTMNLDAQEPTRWRGPEANGNYPDKGLLRSWPANGPEILWSYEGLGQGHSSVAVADKYLFTTGMIDSTGYLFKFSMDGSLQWKKAYGPEFSASWYGTRGTPVVAGNHVYVESGMGMLLCFHASNGVILWSKDLFRDFDGQNITWGLNETPVVDGEIIYVTPGGKQHNVVALNRYNGELVWSSRGKGELSAYCTPLLFEHGGRKILATHTASHLLGLDASNGELLWSQRQPNQYSVHANTPLYEDGQLFYFSGYGQGGGLLELSPDGNSVKKRWFSDSLDSRMGGAVLLDGYLYTSGDYHREGRCVKFDSGEEMYAASDVGKGGVISADGMLFCYSDRGELALVEADPSGFKVLGKTRVTLGSEQHWAHPVIHEGVLYLRHGKALIAYGIK